MLALGFKKGPQGKLWEPARAHAGVFGPGMLTTPRAHTLSMHAGVFGPGMLTTPQARTLSMHANVCLVRACSPHHELAP